MSSTTIPYLPAELLCSIFNLCKPTTTTINILEDEFEVTSVSPPPSLLTTIHSSRAIALQWALKKYPIWTSDDWQDIYLSSEDTTLELVITPSKNSSLNITWTELHAILGDALTEARYLHIVCSEPERLARLFMLPEGEIIGVGESCVEKSLFGSEVISSDRKVRESLLGEVLVTTSARTVEEISQGGKEGLSLWRLGSEEVSEGFGPKAKVFSTKAFERVDVGGWGWRSVRELFEAAKTSPLSYPEEGEGVQKEVEEVEEVEEEVEGSGVELTEEALEKLAEEMVTLHPNTAYKGGKEDPGGSIMPAY